jgi:hypothetical protein
MNPLGRADMFFAPVFEHDAELLRPLKLGDRQGAFTQQADIADAQVPSHEGVLPIEVLGVVLDVLGNLVLVQASGGMEYPAPFWGNAIEHRGVLARTGPEANEEFCMKEILIMAPIPVLSPEVEVVNAIPHALLLDVSDPIESGLLQQVEMEDVELLWGEVVWGEVVRPGDEELMAMSCVCCFLLWCGIEVEISGVHQRLVVSGL